MLGKELFLLNSMKGAKVAAGEKGLNTEVTGVNVMEVPDILNWVKKGEFLITAGYSYKDNPAAFGVLIPKLASKGVAALGIKTRRYFREIPREVIDEGNAYDFLIIELDETVVFSNIVRDLMEEIISNEYKDLSIMQYRITKLSQKLLEGVGLKGMLKQLQEFIHNPVAIIRSDSDFIIDDKCREYFPEQELKPDLYDGHDQEMQGWSYITVNGVNYRTYYYKIIRSAELEAEILLIEMKGPSDNRDILTINQIASMVGLELMNETAKAKVELKYIDQIYQDWITGKIDNEKSLMMRCEICGLHLDIKRRYQVILVNFTEKKSYDSIRSVQIRLSKSLHNERGIYATMVNGTLAVISAVQEMDNIAVIMNNMTVIMNNIAVIQDKLAQICGKNKVQLCIGKPGALSCNLTDSYKDALNIKQVAQKSGLTGEILYYKDLGVYSLLYLIPASEEVDTYLNIYLNPILSYDREHGTNLYETLKVYLDNHGNTKATAALLFTHYNTVGYRLERIAGILDMDIGDTEVQFRLHMGIKLKDMYLS